MIRFLHTADWQAGKTFARIEDSEKREIVRRERLEVIARIAAAAKEHRASFVLVAGDLFDSPGVSDATLSAACSSIGAMGVPVYAIPGNHDHGGPGCLWDRPFFKSEQASLAPNLHLLATPEPVETGDAVILPCPLLRRHEARDPTEWLRTGPGGLAPDKPRIVLAHGGVHGFMAAPDDEDHEGVGANRIDLERLPAGQYDYVALGDWHGTKRISGQAWYCGTPEPDRFPKGDEHGQGNVLAVSVARGGAAEVVPVTTGRLRWHRIQYEIAADAMLAIFESELDRRLGSRIHEDLLRLELSGTLGLDAMSRLEACLEKWCARLLRLRLVDHTRVAPTGAEMLGLTANPDHPLVAAVARKLVDMAGLEDSPRAQIAGAALRALFTSTRTQGSLP